MKRTVIPIVLLILAALLSGIAGHGESGSRHEIQSYQDGAEYRGGWEQGLRHGRGVLVKPDGSEYRGRFRHGEAHGTGLYIYGNGLSKRVVFDNGILVSSDWVPIRSVPGECRYGSFIQNGKYTGWFKGDRVRGFVPHGRGEMKYFNGTVYSGQWKEGRMHGRGIIQWSDGSTYSGEWRDGKRTGRGTYTWASGSRYVGEWRDNVMDGRGTMYREAEVLSGTWDQGLLVSEKK